MILEKENFKKKLKEYRNVRNEIEELTNKIKKLESKVNYYCVVQSSMKVEPYSKVNTKVYQPSLNDKENLEKYIQHLKKRYQSLIEIELEVEKFINEIENSRLRRIFEYRYIHGYSWSKTSICLGGFATADSVRMEHDRFLKKN